MLHIVDILYDIVHGIANNIVFIRFISINVGFLYIKAKLIGSKETCTA
jgi:hypothetical protein